MPMIEAQTELDAVNAMLLSIGQAPVSTLSVSGITDVNIARTLLKTAARRCLAKGWNFNTDDEYEITPNASGYCLVPSGALSVDASSSSPNLVQRRAPIGSMCFYNKDDSTFIFTAPITTKIIWGFDFEDLPEVARNYIATYAGRRFQSRVIGSQILDRFEEEDERYAWVLLQTEERRSADTNMFRRSPFLQSFGDRSY
ncbi:MAG: hypothetical protein EAZ84_09900 [Verrucomicrobia bacterium]|nr:MAG: hypothetical protein EAZ84_09900 [Verrucomicrobiota bacterium]